VYHRGRVGSGRPRRDFAGGAIDGANARRLRRGLAQKPNKKKKTARRRRRYHHYHIITAILITTKMKATTMSRILVALALGSTLTGAHPDRLQCGQELAVGETIMGAAAQAETQFTYANFKLWRKEDPETQLYCTSEFHPGDELQVTLEMSTPDYKWLMTLEHDDFDGTTWHESSYGGFTDACATCGGRRSQGPSCYGNDGPATIKLGSAPLTLRAGFAKSYEVRRR
jgi:hypothetical protein